MERQRPTTFAAIINPAAGSNRAGKQWAANEAALNAAGYDVQPVFTDGPGDAIRIVPSLIANGHHTIICAGGDGTANEVINGILELKTPAERPKLALIPCGTGRDLGRSLGTGDITATIAALQAESVACIDVGRISYVDKLTGNYTTRHFANVADIGLGAQAADRINNTTKAFGGLASYLGGAVRTIFDYKPWHAQVEIDGERVWDDKVGMVVFANGRYFAGGMHVAPEASLCDGQLDVFILKGLGKRHLLGSVLPRVYKGRHVDHHGVVHLRGTTASVQSDATMPMEMDGEQIGIAPLEIGVVPRALRIVCRPDMPALPDGCADCDP